MYISSDKIRDRLYHGTESDPFQMRADKYATRMMALSEGAFKVLEAEYSAAMKYPSAKPVIIVDSTGLSDQFRQKMVDMARENHYFPCAVVFNLDTQELLAAPNSVLKKTLIMTQQRRLRQEVLASLRPFHKTYRIDKRTASPPSIVFAGAALYRQCQLDPKVTWHILGDVHASYETMIKALKKLKGVTIAGGLGDCLELDERTGIVLAGDILDKGTQLPQTLEWTHRYRLHPRVKIVMGNHERRVANILNKYSDSEEPSESKETGLLVPSPNFEDHAVTLLVNPFLEKMFREIYQVCLPFVQLHGTAMDQVEFIVTHSPCDNKYLGKIDGKSVTHQRYFHYGREDQYQAVAAFLQKQSLNARNFPYHIFGHVPVAEARVFGNQIAIDTGCGMGGALTVVTMTKERPRFITIKDDTSQLAGPPFINIPHRASGKADAAQEVDPQVEHRVQLLQQQGVNFISGTISPCGSCVSADGASADLESLREGLKYFAHKGVTRVVMQPKYMGSRCQIYLFPQDIPGCYAVSRNGYVIKFKQEGHLERFHELCRNLALRLKNKLPPFTLAIIDGEILPWSFMGQGLINEFHRYGAAFAKHLSLLDKYGFSSVLDKETAWATNFRTEYNVDVVKKEDVMKKLTEEKRGFWYGKYRGLTELQMKLEGATWEQQKENLAIYKRQMDLYGMPVVAPADIVFKPFEVLKVVGLDGQEQVLPFPPDVSFRMLQDDAIHIINLSEGDCREKAQAFFDSVSRDLCMEGVVLKALDGGAEVPFLKVRNDNYLTIIYGPNYRQSAQFAKGKKIHRKLKESEIEWNLGLQMLRRPYATLLTDTEFRKVAIDFVQEEERASAKMDARL